MNFFAHPLMLIIFQFFTNIELRRGKKTWLHVSRWEDLNFISNSLYKIINSTCFAKFYNLICFFSELRRICVFVYCNSATNFSHGYFRHFITARQMWLSSLFKNYIRRSRSAIIIIVTNRMQVYYRKWETGALCPVHTGNNVEATLSNATSRTILSTMSNWHSCWCGRSRTWD